LDFDLLRDHRVEALPGPALQCVRMAKQAAPLILAGDLPPSSAHSTEYSPGATPLVDRGCALFAGAQASIARRVLFNGPWHAAAVRPALSLWP
jgi:hypothetical protein